MLNGFNESTRKMTKEFQRQSETYKQQIAESLAKIDWKLRDVGCGYFRFVNQRGEAKPIVFCYDRIELETEGFDYSIYFHLKDTEMTEVKIGDKVDVISFRGKSDNNIFLHCNNFDREK